MKSGRVEVENIQSLDDLLKLLEGISEETDQETVLKRVNFAKLHLNMIKTGTDMLLILEKLKTDNRLESSMFFLTTYNESMLITDEDLKKMFSFFIDKNMRFQIVKRINRHIHTLERLLLVLESLDGLSMLDKNELVKAHFSTLAQSISAENAKKFGLWPDFECPQDLSSSDAMKPVSSVSWREEAKQRCQESKLQIASVRSKIKDRLQELEEERAASIVQLQAARQESEAFSAQWQAEFDALKRQVIGGSSISSSRATSKPMPSHFSASIPGYVVSPEPQLINQPPRSYAKTFTKVLFVLVALTALVLAFAFPHVVLPIIIALKLTHVILTAKCIILPLFFGTAGAIVGNIFGRIVDKIKACVGPRQRANVQPNAHQAVARPNAPAVLPRAPADLPQHVSAQKVSHAQVMVSSGLPSSVGVFAQERLGEERQPKISTSPSSSF